MGIAFDDGKALFDTSKLKIATKWEMMLARLFGRTRLVEEDGFTWRFDFFRGNTYVSQVKQNGVQYATMQSQDLSHNDQKSS